MSDIENRKVQDILREVANKTYLNDGSAYVVVELSKSLGIKENKFSCTYGQELRACLNEIANRIDRQSVVEVRVPSPFQTQIGALHIVPIEPDKQPKLEPAELEAMTPAIIDVHDCIIDVHIHGGIDDQD